MSSHAYPMLDTGLVINDELCAYMIKYAYTTFPEDAANNAEVLAALKLSDEDFIAAAKEGTLPDEFTDPGFLADFIETDEDMTDLIRLSSFEGCAETDKDIAKAYELDESQTVYIDFDYTSYGAYISLSKEANLFRQAYSTPADVVDELVSAIGPYGKFVPKDFNMIPLICTIKGVVFG